jgi:hypothetical protein
VKNHFGVGVMKDKEMKFEDVKIPLTLGLYTPLIHWVVSLLLSYILRYVSFGEVGRVFRVPLHLCTYVIEEGGDGEAT